MVDPVKPQPQPQSSDSDWETVNPNGDGNWENVNPANNNDEGFFGGLYSNTLQPLIQTAQTVTSGDPSKLMDIGRGIMAQQSASGQNLENAVKSGDAMKMFDAALYTIPGIGPQLQHMDELFKQGNHSGAAGEMSGLLLSLLGPEMTKPIASRAADLIDAGAQKVSPRVSNMMNQYIGLQPSDLQKFERFNPGNPEEIGNTVYNEAGMKNNLAAQHKAITDAINRKLQEQGDIINRANAQTVPSSSTAMMKPGSIVPAGTGQASGYAQTVKADIPHMLADRVLNLADELSRESGMTPAMQSALQTNYEALMREYGVPKSPSEMLEMRNNLRKSITDWNPKSTNIEQRLRQDIYHSLNDHIEGSLASPQDMLDWRTNNRTLNRLIIGENAAGEKLTKGAMKYDSPIKSGLKFFSPSKWPDLVSNDTVIPREMSGRQSVSRGLKNEAQAIRQKTPDVARFLSAPALIVPKDDQQ